MGCKEALEQKKTLLVLFDKLALDTKIKKSTTFSVEGLYTCKEL